MATSTSSDIARMLVQAQDDNDTVVLPNLCRGQLVEFEDDKQIRCFSIVTKQPHTVPPDAWTIIQTPELPKVPDIHDVECGAVLVDHVTRGIISDNAMQFITATDGNIEKIRLLPPGSGAAQQQWEAQAAKMIQ